MNLLELRQNGWNFITNRVLICIYMICGPNLGKTFDFDLYF